MKSMADMVAAQDTGSQKCWRHQGPRVKFGSVKKNDTPEETYAVFSVTEDQWEEFIDMMDDSDTQFETWAEWNASFDQFRVESNTRKFKVAMVPVDLNEFREWCERRQLPMAMLSRIRYAEECFQEGKNS